jgi:hypothetical protein
MKKTVSIPAIIVILFLVGFKYSDNWITYKSNAGHYSISFPGDPKESDDKDTTDEGKPFDIHFATYAPNDDEVYMAGWIDMRTFYPENKSMKKLLEDSRDGAAGSMKTTKVTTLKTNLEGNPFIEFSFSTKDFTGKDRIYVINKFQYSIITIFSLKSGIPKTADKFIQSFKHIE